MVQEGTPSSSHPVMNETWIGRTRDCRGSATGPFTVPGRRTRKKIIKQMLQDIRAIHYQIVSRII